MQQLLKSWKCRYLSLKGKITVINTLALSQLIYLCSIIYVPENVYSEVKKIILDFLWDGKPAKISYNTLIQGIENGGLKLIDLKSKVKSLSIAWIKRLTGESDAKWKFIPKILYKTCDLKFYFLCNSSPLTAVIQPKFYQYIQNIWAEMMEVNELAPSIIHNQVLWNNRYITIQNKSFYWKKWKDAGIIRVHDLITNNNFLSANELSIKYSIQINFLEALQIRQSLPHSWRMLVNSSNPVKVIKDLIYFEKNEVKVLNKTESKKIYLYFISQKKMIPTSVHKWSVIYPNITIINWPNIFKLSFVTTRETRLQSFQYRILHRVIPCRKKLYEMGLVESSICTVCPEVDNIQHFFFKCSYVNDFWIDLLTWLDLTLNCTLDIDEKRILFGIDGVSDIDSCTNFVILHAKFYIYRLRINNNHNLSITSFKAQLKQKLEIEKIISRQNRPQQFIKFQLLLDEL